MTGKVCDVQRVRVIAFVAVCLGVASPAFAEIDEAKIEKARSGSLSTTFQDDLPGYEWVPSDGSSGEDGDGLERGGPSRQGSGSAGKAVPSKDPRKADRRNGQRDSARRVEDRVDTREQVREQESGVSDVMTMFMWGLIAVAAGLLLFWFLSEVGKGDADVAGPAADEDKAAAVKAATAAIIDRPLSDADELAARGMYAEAIHTLLLKTLHELARHASVRIEQSHTSREILRRVQLSPDPRDALGVLITYVELTHFGDEPAGSEDYMRCREQFHVFASAFKAGLAIATNQPSHLAGGGTSLAS